MRTREEAAAFVQAKLAYSGSTGLRRRVWTDVLNVYDETLQQSATGAHTGVGPPRNAGPRRMLSLAALAVGVLGLLILGKYAIRREAPSQPEPQSATHTAQDVSARDRADRSVSLTEELAQGLFAKGDLAGLLRLLETGRPETRVRVAGYLGLIGDHSVIPALQSLAAQWSGPAHENPFEKAIEAIQKRLDTAEPSPGEGHAEPNDASDLPSGPNDLQAPSAAKLSRVAGIVVDSQEGLPIPNAVVGLRRGERTTTDAQGRFALPCAASGDILCLYAGAPGYADARVSVRVQEAMPPALTITLDRGSGLAGTIVDPNGTPVRNASVNIVGLQSLDWTFVTDANGRFEVEGLDPVARGYSVYVVHPGYPSLMTRIQPAPAGQTLSQTFALRPGAVLFGQVTDPDGQPVAGATVGNTRSGRMWNCLEARTDEHGMYELGLVPTGDHTLWVTHGQYAPFVGSARLQRDETEHRVDIQLSGGRALIGRVVDDRGLPVPEAVVKIDAHGTVRDLVETVHLCDPNGCFTIPNAPDRGELSLYVRGERITGKRHEVDFAQDECLIAVSRRGRIYGRVVDAVTGQPISPFTVRMDFSRTANCSAGFSVSWSEEGHRFDSPDGLFDTGLEKLPVGGVLLMTVSAEGYDPVTIDPVVVLPIDERAHRTEFELPVATVLAGRVTDAGGGPIRGAQALFFTRENLCDPGRRPSALTDETGVFTISGLGSWDHQYVFVSADGFGPQVWAMADLLEGPGLLADIALEPAATVAGRVTDGQGRGLANAQVWGDLNIEHKQAGTDDASSEQLRTWHPPGLGPGTYTNAEGNYQLSGLPAGRVAVSVFADGADHIKRQQVELSPGETVTLDFADESDP